MEKTITIDGKEITFKSTGATPMRYKAQFGREFFADLTMIAGTTGEFKKEDISSVNFETFYNIAWTLAKAANKDIPSPIEWLDTFDEFPIFDILPEIQDMMISSIQSKKK